MSGPTTLSAKQRARVRQDLEAILTRRDIPLMPEQEIRRLTDRDLGYLLRFWTHKDQHWDELNPPPFREEPPQGWAKMFAAVVNGSGDIVAGATPKPVKRRVINDNYRETNPWSNFGRQFKGPGGGYLTPRQAFALKTKDTN